MRAAVLAIGLIFVLGASAAAASMTQKEIEESLACQCGCGLTVHACNHMQCPFAVPVRKEIAEQLAAGKTGKEIIAGYVAKYGEKVLSSPTTKGFNLLAWYAPYLALLLGGVVVVFAVRRWARSAPESGPPGPTQGLSDEQRARLQRELDKS